MPARLLVPLLLLPLLASGCVKNPVTGKREVHLISKEAELRLGQESKSAIVKEYGLYQNPQLQAYINAVGQKVVSVTERREIPYEFVILDTSLVNAFAVPGCVFLTRGILELIDDEAELAAVIGHEVGHVTGYHSVKLIQKSYGYGFLATLAAVAGTVYAPDFQDTQSYAAYYDTLYRGISLVAAGFLSGYGRRFELEADRSGLRYAILAGYDPDAMISFFKRMGALSDDSDVSVFLRTHPPTKERISRVKKEIVGVQEAPERGRLPKNQVKVAEILKSSAAELKDNFDTYQEIVRSIPKKDSDREGLIEGGTYTHRGLGFRIEVPHGWRLEYSYGSALANFTSPDRKAQGEIKVKNIMLEPTLAAGKKASVAGVAASTAGVSSAEWAKAVEEGLRLQRRTGREVQYPAGPSYVGTYRGYDKVGRPAFFKILFLVRGRKSSGQDGYAVTLAAPLDTYLDYLPDFEVILKSLSWLPSQP